MTADHISSKDWLVEDEEGEEVAPSAPVQPAGLFSFNDKGLVIVGNPGIEEWRHTYRTIKTIAKDSYRKVGDLLVYGELTYGDLIDQESDESDYEDPVFNAGTLYNAKYVSSRWWPPERRVYNLPWSFYQETSPLKPHQQEALMQQAESEGWTRDKLRQTVAGYQQANGKREYVPTRPGDIIAEQQRQIDAMREDADRASRESHAALDSIDPATLPELDDMARPIIGWLKQVNYSAMVIKRTGEVVIKP